MKGPMETLEAQQEKEPNQEKAPRDVDAPKSHSGKNPIESLHLMELKTLKNLDGLFPLDEQEIINLLVTQVTLEGLCYL